MNILTDSVPESICVSGAEYPIKTDFKTWIKYEQLILDEHEQGVDLNKIFNLIFKDKKPPMTQEAIDQIVWFYNCGQDTTKGNSEYSKPIISFEHDGSYIYAALFEQYQIEINHTNKHWWEFRALMFSLSDETMLAKIMTYRAMKISPKMSAEQKAFYSKMKKLYALPENETIRKKDKEIEEALMRGEDIDDLLL